MVSAGLLLLGCDSRGEPPRPADYRPPPSRQAWTVDGAVDAFDLRVHTHGALLVYARGGAIHAQPLDPEGRPRGPEARAVVVGGTVVALVVGASAGRAALAWLRRDGARVHVEAALGAGRPLAFGPALMVDGWRSDSASAAHALGERELALRVTATGAFRLLHRATPVACADHEACATFGHTELVAAPRARTSRPALAAPQVCPWPLSGVVESAGRTYYGLCTQEAGVPRSTLYLLQPEPQYAQADVAFLGCQPRGTLALGRDHDEQGARAAVGALFAADCPSGREVVRLSVPGVAPEPVGAVLAPECVLGVPALRAGSVRVPLRASRDRIEGFVPAAWAPALSRVVWTGARFVTASRADRTLTVRATSCAEAGGAE